MWPWVWVDLVTCCWSPKDSRRSKSLTASGSLMLSIWMLKSPIIRFQCFSTHSQRFQTFLSKKLNSEGVSTIKWSLYRHVGTLKIHRVASFSDDITGNLNHRFPEFARKAKLTEISIGHFPFRVQASVKLVSFKCKVKLITIMTLGKGGGGGRSV